MDELFLDTSFLVAYYNIDDEHHVKAQSLMQGILKDNYNIIVSDYIFNECCTVLSIRLKDFKKTIEICNLIKSIKMLRVDDWAFERAFEIFREQKETKMSFTDCSNLALMEANGIKNIATFDEDFTKIKGINLKI